MAFLEQRELCRTTDLPASMFPMGIRMDPMMPEPDSLGDLDAGFDRKKIND
jgi:hypothetical protein